MLISSVETALVKVTNDLLPVGDSRLITILILLDLNAAFDTISHHILLYRSASIGINNMALAWFPWYLSSCSQFVQLHTQITIQLINSVYLCLSAIISFNFTVMQMTPTSICIPNPLPLLHPHLFLNVCLKLMVINLNVFLLLQHLLCLNLTVFHYLSIIPFAYLPESGFHHW